MDARAVTGRRSLRGDRNSRNTQVFHEVGFRQKTKKRKSVVQEIYWRSQSWRSWDSSSQGEPRGNGERQFKQLTGCVYSIRGKLIFSYILIGYGNSARRFRSALLLRKWAITRGIIGPNTLCSLHDRETNGIKNWLIRSLDRFEPGIYGVINRGCYQLSYRGLYIIFWLYRDSRSRALLPQTLSRTDKASQESSPIPRWDLLYDDAERRAMERCLRNSWASNLTRGKKYLLPAYRRNKPAHTRDHKWPRTKTT